MNAKPLGFKTGAASKGKRERPNSSPTTEVMGYFIEVFSRPPCGAVLARGSAR